MFVAVALTIVVALLFWIFVARPLRAQMEESLTIVRQMVALFEHIPGAVDVLIGDLTAHNRTQHAGLSDLVQRLEASADRTLMTARLVAQELEERERLVAEKLRAREAAVDTALGAREGSVDTALGVREEKVDTATTGVADDLSASIQRATETRHAGAQPGEAADAALTMPDERKGEDSG